MGTNSEQKNYIIAGGGLAGLFAARILKNFGAQNIFIVEKAERTRGLLQSVSIENPLGDGEDYSFDYGTHFVLMPKRPEIQDILFKDLDTSKYHRFDDSLQEGHFFNGTLYEASGCISLLSLPSDTRERIKLEMKELAAAEEKKTKNPPDTVEEACLQQYGTTATSFLKNVYQKLTGVPFNELAASMQGKLFPLRVILAGREESIALKKDPAWDDRLAYADCKDSKSDIVKFYPKKGGIGQWLDTMTGNLKKDGVEIITGATIVSLKTNAENEITSVTLSNGRNIDCGLLVWTLPAIFLSLITKVTVPSSKPQIRPVSLCHFITDKRPVSRPYWITNLDKNFKFYRTTLYDNITGDNPPSCRLTVEILGDVQATNDNIHNEIFDELKRTSILPDDSKALWSATTHKAEGFPLLKPGVSEIYHEQMDILEKTFPNVCFAGRRSESGHGQIPIMQNAYDVLKEVFLA